MDYEFLWIMSLAIIIIYGHNYGFRRGYGAMVGVVIT